MKRPFTHGFPVRYRAGLAVLIALCLPLPAPLAAQEAAPKKSTLARVLGNLLEAESSIRISEAGVKSAYEGYRDIISQSYPQVSFVTSADSSPLYGFRRTTQDPQAPGAASATSVSPGFLVTQALPTAGNLALSLRNSMTISTQGDTDRISQSPSLSLSLSQPMFLNGKVIDLSLLGTSLRMGKIGWEKAKTADTDSVNTAVTRAASLYLNAVRLRKQAASLESAIKIDETRLRQLEVRYQQGQASRSDVRELELALGKERETFLEVRYNLKEAVRNLARMTGSQNLTEEELSDTFAMPEVPGIESALAGALETNGDVVSSRLDLERTRLQGSLDGTKFQSDLSVNFSVTPKYPAVRDAEDDFGSSWSDLFAEDSFLEYSGGIGIRIPLYTGGQRSHQKNAQSAKESAALEGLEAARRAVRDGLELVLQKRGYLGERVTLLEATVAHREELLRREEKLLELKATTPIEVETARHDLSDAKDDLWFARAEIYLNSLDFLQAAGLDLSLVPGIVERETAP